MYMLGSYLELFARAKHTFRLYVYPHAASPWTQSSLSVYPGTPNNYFCSCPVDKNSSCVRAARTENCLYMLRSHLELFWKVESRRSCM